MTAVSYILPVYKAEKYLDSALESIRAQEDGSREIILVDDGSPDNSAILCDRAALDDPDIIVVHRKNAGSGYARNVGLNCAKGEYICFLDPDDTLGEGLAKENLALAKKEKSDIVVFGHHIIYENRTGSIAKTETALPALAGNYSYKEFLGNFFAFWGGNPSTVWGKLFLREYLDKSALRFTNQSVGQDAVFMLDVYDSPFSKITFLQKPYYEHVLREGSAVDRYHENRYQSEMNIAERLDKLLEKRGLIDGECKFLAAERYMSVLCLEGSNAVKPESGMNFIEKARHIRTLAKIPRVSWAIKTLPLSFFKGNKQKLIQLFLFKARFYTAFILLKKLVVKKTWN